MFQTSLSSTYPKVAQMLFSSLMLTLMVRRKEAVLLVMLLSVTLVVVFPVGLLPLRLLPLLRLQVAVVDGVLQLCQLL